jgi:hypothetical protein
MITISISRRALVLGLLLLALAAALSAAGLVIMVATRGGDGETDNWLTLRDKLLNDLAPQQEDLEFDIIVPSYLPVGTMELANGLVDDDRLDIFFQIAPDKMAPPDQQAFIQIAEEASTQRPLEPVDFVMIDGRRVGIERNVGPADQVWVSLWATWNSVAVTVNVSWTADRTQETIVLTDEMKQEAVKVFDSMLED